jgi:hypothetical protein
MPFFWSWVTGRAYTISLEFVSPEVETTPFHRISKYSSKASILWEKWVSRKLIQIVVNPKVHE